MSTKLELYLLTKLVLLILLEKPVLDIRILLLNLLLPLYSATISSTTTTISSAAISFTTTLSTTALSATTLSTTTALSSSAALLYYTTL